MIGHNVVLHGCRIAANSLVGMGAVVLNGAKIGRGCLIGANALVTEGKEFSDNSLIVGSPARALRSLDERAAAMILRAQIFTFGGGSNMQRRSNASHKFAGAGSNGAAKEFIHQITASANRTDHGESIATDEKVRTSRLAIIFPVAAWYFLK